MNRRQFLGWGLGATVAFSLSRRASGSETRPPLWLHVHAGGGWDPTLLCDPRPGLSGLSFGVGETSATTAGHRFRYADLGGAAASIPNDNGFEFAAFFETWAEKLVVLNGIWTESAGHRSGARYAASGRLMEGYPSLWAMFAAHHGVDRSMPYLTGDGASYSAGGGLVTPTRLTDLRYFEQIADPNMISSGTSETYYTEDEWQWLNAARAARMERLIEQETRPHLIHRLEQVESTRYGQADLKAFQAAWDLGARITLPAKSNKNSGALRLFNSGLQTLLGWELGMTSAGALGGGGFDTHNRHDQFHPQALQNLLLGLHLILQEAEVRGVPLVMVVTSEFGRTAGYNVDDGKDHWPTTSWMLLQTEGANVLQGGLQIGASEYDDSSRQIRPQPLDRDTLELSETGTFLNPEALHVWLRHRAELAETDSSAHQFPLRADLWGGLDGRLSG